MGAFKYEGINKDGKRISGELDARSSQDVKRILRREGIKATRIKTPSILELDFNAWIVDKTGAKAFGDKDLARFTGNLHTLVDAGVPLLQSLEILGKQERVYGLKKSIKNISVSVSDGKSLHEAMQNEKVFGKLFCQLIKAGEIGGILDKILLKLASFLERKIELRKKIKGALTYPAVIVTVGIGVITIMMAFVVPQFMSMIKDSGQEVPFLTQLVTDISNFFAQYFLFLFLGAFFAAISFFGSLRTKSGKEAFDKIILQVPLFNTITIKGNLSGFTQTLATLISSGVPIVEALDVCNETIDNVIIAQDLAKVKVAVLAGKNLTEPLKRIKYFPELVAQMIEVGESTGNLDTMLGKVAKIFEMEVESAIKQMTQLIEPIILVVLGGIIAVVLVAIYLPIFMSAGGVG
ncbi:MAG: type II secretion system F family protein [Bacteriovoracaceae bacterium]|nr:type II secretion system F family protein [Bacteriovoracaceae bacterium]